MFFLSSHLPLFSIPYIIYSFSGKACFCLSIPNLIEKGKILGGKVFHLHGKAFHVNGKVLHLYGKLFHRVFFPMKSCFRRKDAIFGWESQEFWFAFWKWREIGRKLPKSQKNAEKHSVHVHNRWYKSIKRRFFRKSHENVLTERKNSRTFASSKENNLG